MDPVQIIAELLTEDPDIFNKIIILAVHPNYVIDAAAQADSSEEYKPHRLNILKNYISRFKNYINKQKQSGATIIITTLGNPYYLDVWQSEGTDTIEGGMEQEEVYQLHQDLMDYIHQLANDPKVYITPEEYAGAACRQGKLDHILNDVDEVQVIGGNLTGCLKNTVEALGKRPSGPTTRIVHELSFDDDPKFWKANL